jgi:translation initiation factor 1 (eIF-1/SUI1)
VYEEKTYEKPTTIITQIEALDEERQDLLKQLKGLIT